ncbi:DUF4376 domain-containing protein [Citrobacter freundii]
MKIKEIINPRYLENGSIDCEIFFDGMDEAVPYTATADDTAKTGQQIWLELHNGKWGDIAPFVVTAEMLIAAKNAKHNEISRWRDVQESSNIIFELDGHRWDGGKTSQERLAPVIAAANAGMLPEGFFWTDADNHDIPVNTELLQQLEEAMVQAMVIQGFKIHARQRQMKGEVSALHDLDSIINYRVSWPNDNE